MRFRHLTAEEAKLWREVTRQTRPLRPQDEDIVLEDAPRIDTPKLRARRIEAPQASHSSMPLPALGQFAGVDSSSSQRLKRGNYPIDRRLDLHGMTRDQAMDTLLFTLQQAYASGKRCVLVITGKGRGGAVGVLKENVPRWLSDAQFSPYVLAFDHAARQHGGDGAIYVLVRRKRGGA